MSLRANTIRRVRPVLVAAMLALPAFVVPVFTAPANAATTSLAPTDDATVREDRPDRNYGIQSSLEVDRSSRKDALIRFDVPGGVAAGIASATLRLYVTDSAPTGGDVARAADSDWKESLVTWTTAPAAGPALGDLGPVSAGTWVSIDVTHAVTAEGPVTFRISSTSSNGADYAAKEKAGGTAPQLVLSSDESEVPPGPPAPESVRIPVGGDATVREDRPDRSYGLDPKLEVDLSARKDILLGFDVTGVGKRTVERATLRLFVLDPSKDGGAVAAAGPATWNEKTVTWNTAPAASEVLGRLGSVRAGTWVDVDVTSAVQGDGSITLRLASASADGADYASRQDTSGRSPELVLTLGPPAFYAQPSLPIRAAFYYPWYPEVWTVQGSDVFYHPKLGYYSSDDAAVQRAHIEALTDAGLDAAISSWWGFPNARDDRFAELLDQTVALGSPLKWAAYQEGEGRADPSPAEIAVDLEHLKELAASPAYLRVDGRFVVFVYNADNTDGCAVVDRWEQANALIGDEAYISLLIFPGYRDCPNQPDAWHQYAPAHAADQRPGYTYMISPGFWRADEAQPRLERDLDRWRQNVQDMVASGEPWQLVVSFNEWGEGTAVEASEEWSTSYLDVLAEELAPEPWR